MRDLTRGNPLKLIVLFSIPLLIGNVFQQFYNMADTLIVGRTLGVDALAAVGATGSLSFLIIGFSQGLSVGLSIITAQYFGAKDYHGVKRSLVASIFIAGAVSVVLTVFSVIFAKPILILMQTPPELIDNAYAFIVVIFAGIGASVSFNLLSNMLRALGDSRTPLFFLIVASLVNIGLDFLFILVFHSGVAGAGYATVLAQIFASVLCFLYIRKNIPELHLAKKDWTFDKQEILKHLRIGSAMGFQMSIIAIGAIILQTTINRFGATAVAAFTTAQKIEQLAMQPFISFGISMSTFAAQNYGAKQFERIRKGVREIWALAGSLSIVIGASVIIWGNHLVGLFIGSEQRDVVQLAQVYFNVNSSMYFFLATLFILRYTLQGLGNTKTPTIASILELAMRILGAIVFASLFGFAGAAFSEAGAWIAACIPLFISYRRTDLSLKKQMELAQMEH